MTGKTENVRLTITSVPEKRVDDLRTVRLNMMARAFLGGIMLLLGLASAASPAPSGDLSQAAKRNFPEGWAVRILVSKPLTGNSDSSGRWESFELRSPEGKVAALQFLPETAAGTLFIPAGQETRVDGSLGMGATYKVVEMDSFRAICEIHPYLGSTVTSSLPTGEILVIESKNLTVEDLLELTRFIHLSPPGSENFPEPILVVP